MAKLMLRSEQAGERRGEEPHLASIIGGSQDAITPTVCPQASPLTSLSLSSITVKWGDGNYLTGC